MTVLDLASLAVAVLLVVYLGVALLLPEKFE